MNIITFLKDKRRLFTTVSLDRPVSKRARKSQRKRQIPKEECSGYKAMFQYLPKTFGMSNTAKDLPKSRKGRGPRIIKKRRITGRTPFAKGIPSIRAKIRRN